jgi:hypothetical protein
MNERDVHASRPRTPVHLWIVGVLTLLWNLMGAFDYLATELRFDAYMSQFSQEQLDYFYSFPWWAVAAWAIAVWLALAGSITLLLRRKWAVCLFGTSFLGLIVTTIYNFGLSNGAELMGAGAVIFTFFIWLIAIFLVLYSWWLTKKGVLV